MIQEPQTLPNGTVIQGTNGARYIIEELRGTGGFSAVYRVRDRRTRRVFALKELINAYDRDRRHLIIEARLLKKLLHPALPHVYQVFEDTRRNRIYMLMDYIEGRDLETLRREQPENSLQPGTALSLMAPIFEATSYLHEQTPPVIHRDIKPANIIVPGGEGRPTLVDFGLAKEYVEDKTTNVFRYGTPGYAAPEQYGQGTNLRTDIYALGATLYTLLTGLIPPDALTRTLEREHGDPLIPADEVNPQVPHTVALVIDRAMNLRLEQRFASVAEFWHALKKAAPHYAEPATKLPEAPPATPVIMLETSSLSQSRLIRPSGRGDGNKAHAALRVETDHAHASVQVKKTSQPHPFKMVIVVLVLLIIAGTTVSGFLYYKIWTRQQTLAAQHTDPQSTKITVIEATPHPSPTPTATPTRILPCEPGTTSETNPGATVPFPPLEKCYMGTIYDLGIHQKTALYLWNIEQQHGQISGDFLGLTYTGKFSGKVTTDGEISFKVDLKRQKLTMTFTGTIKLGGDITGEFETMTIDTAQQRGNTGKWYLCTPENALCYPKDTPTSCGIQNGKYTECSEAQRGNRMIVVRVFAKDVPELVLRKRGMPGTRKTLA